MLGLLLTFLSCARNVLTFLLHITHTNIIFSDRKSKVFFFISSPHDPLAFDFMFFFVVLCLNVEWRNFFFMDSNSQSHREWSERELIKFYCLRETSSSRNYEGCRMTILTRAKVSKTVREQTKQGCCEREVINIHKNTRREREKEKKVSQAYKLWMVCRSRKTAKERLLPTSQTQYLCLYAPLSSSSFVAHSTPLAWLPHSSLMFAWNNLFLLT